MPTKSLPSIAVRYSVIAILLLVPVRALLADDGGRPPISDAFAVLHQPTGDWYEVGDAMLNPDQNRLLVGKSGTGALVNGKTGRTNSLVTKEAYQDVQVHVEFMVAKGANSGVIFHGNYEIQILDSAHVEAPTGAHCGGVYPRAEGEPGTPSYRHIDAGSPPRVNAAKPPGQWQTMDIIFQSPRFDEDGNKTANAKFVKVVHNGAVVQENHEMPYAHGPNWDRQQFPNGRVVLQGDYGPIAFRNIRVRPWAVEEESSSPVSHRRQTVGDDGDHALPSVATERLNVPPEGFTALFNGKDLTGWHTRPEVLENWFVEDGLLKSTTLVEHYRASLVTKNRYRDFILMLEFRMPTISDSGICFRRLIPEIPGFGTMEQFNLRSKGGMGHLESYYFLPKETAEKVGLKDEEKPHVRHIDPEVGVWHKVTLTMKGRTFSAEYDGEMLHDNFQFHDWMMNMDPAPILLQKHMVVRGDNLGDENPCPIEYRNVFIKELRPGDVASAPSPSQGEGRGEGQRSSRPMDSPNAELLAQIDKNDLPKAYNPSNHQEYVDRRIAELTDEQRGMIHRLWQEKQRLDPDMPNRGFSFVRIMTYVAERKRDARKTTTSVVLLPESRLSVSGRLATECPVYFGITINHPNGDFAGRFQTVYPADEFRNGEDFQVTLAFQDFQLDSSLAGMKGRLPNEPFHFVIESIWFTTLEKKAGLEKLKQVDSPENTLIIYSSDNDLLPLLKGRTDAFVRHQPLFWLLPASGPAVAIRDGRYSLVAHRAYEFPRDTVTMAALRQQIEETLRRNGTLEDEIRGSTHAFQ